MNSTDIAGLIKTPGFWVISAIASVALSVIGNLVTPKVAEAIAKRNSNRRKTIEKERARFLGEVIIRVNRPEKILHTKIDSIHSFLVACVFMLLALLLFSAATALEWLLIPSLVRMFVVFVAIFIVWFSMFLTKDGMRRRRIALSAIAYLDKEEKLKELHPNDTLAVRKNMDDWLLKKFGMRLDDIRMVLSPSDPDSVAPQPGRSDRPDGPKQPTS